MSARRHANDEPLGLGLLPGLAAWGTRRGNQMSPDDVQLICIDADGTSGICAPREPPGGRGESASQGSSGRHGHAPGVSRRGLTFVVEREVLG